MTGSRHFTGLTGISVALENHLSNPHKPSERFQPYQLGESTLIIFRGVRSILSFLFHLSMTCLKANRIAPDGTPRFAASHLGLFRLPMSHEKGSRLIGINSNAILRLNAHDIYCNFRVENDNDIFLFLLKTEIVSACWNHLIRVAVTSTHNLCLRTKIRNRFTIYYTKVLLEGSQIYGHVSRMLSWLCWLARSLNC